MSLVKTDVPDDRKGYDELKKLCERMTEQELDRFVRGTMNALIIAEHVFKQRFPEQWKKWDDEIEKGEGVEYE